MSEIYINPFEFMDQNQEWTISEKKFLKRLVRIKYDVIEKSGVSPKIKDSCWRKLTKDFNRAEIRAYKIPRTTMELRLQWEKMTEKEFTRKTRKLWSRMYDETRENDFAISEFILLDTATWESMRVKRRNSPALNEEANSNDHNLGPITVKTNPTENKDAANTVNQIEEQIFDIDTAFWTNKIERINAQCEMSGNKN